MKRLSYQRLLSSKYIPSQGIAFDLFQRRTEHDPKWKWIPIRRLPIRAVKIDRRRLQYEGDTSRENIDHIFRNFYQEAWEPIEITEDYYLLNGMVQLKVAERIGLRYIDAVMKIHKTAAEKLQLRKMYRRVRAARSLKLRLFRQLGIEELASRG